MKKDIKHSHQLQTGPLGEDIWGPKQGWGINEPTYRPETMFSSLMVSTDKELLLLLPKLNTTTYTVNNE